MSSQMTNDVTHKQINVFYNCDCVYGLSFFPTPTSKHLNTSKSEQQLHNWEKPSEEQNAQEVIDFL